MARQKNTTAKRGRPPKNAVKKRGPGRPRKVRGTETAIGAGIAGFPEMTQAQKDMDNRHAAVRIALEANRAGLVMSARALVREAQVLFEYIVNGVSEPAVVAPVPIPEAGPIGSGGIAGPYEGNTARTHQLGEAAE